MPCKQGFIHLNMPASGIDKRPDFTVDAIAQISGKAPPVMIKTVSCCIHDCHRPRKGEFDRPRTDRLAGGKIMWAVGRVFMANRLTNGRQIGRIGPVPQHAMFQMIEIKSADMAAMVMDIILAPHLTIGWHIDPGGNLQGDDALCGTHKQRLISIRGTIGRIAAGRLGRIHFPCVTRRIKPVVDG
ncbi:MAG: Uncharacterised protein [SAR116 cluster bacterium]|nr:MAG: Uncharacterised protein [SAR116 cluster bacterium]